MENLWKKINNCAYIHNYGTVQFRLLISMELLVCFSTWLSTLFNGFYTVIVEVWVEMCYLAFSGNYQHV